MRDAASHVGPGCPPLIRQLLADVIKGDNDAIVVPRHLHRQCLGVAAPVQLGMSPGMAGPDCLLKQVGQRRGNRRERLIGQVGHASGEKLGGGAVGELDHPAPVERHHARRYTGQHCLHEFAALIELIVGGNERGLLHLQLRRHPVEGAGQHAQFIGTAPDRHPRCEIAGPHPFRCPHQPPDWRDQPVGEPQREPDRGGKDQQRHHEQHDEKPPLQAAGPFNEGAIFAGGGRGSPDLRQHLRINLAADIEVAFEERVNSD